MARFTTESTNKYRVVVIETREQLKEIERSNRLFYESLDGEVIFNHLDGEGLLTGKQCMLEVLEDESTEQTKPEDH